MIPENVFLRFANSKGTDQPTLLRRLVCPFVVCPLAKVASLKFPKYNFNFHASLSSLGDSHACVSLYQKTLKTGFVTQSPIHIEDLTYASAYVLSNLLNEMR